MAGVHNRQHVASTQRGVTPFRHRTLSCLHRAHLVRHVGPDPSRPRPVSPEVGRPTPTPNSG